MVQEHLLIGIKRLGVVLLILISGILEGQNRLNIWELSHVFQMAPKCELRYLNGVMDTIAITRTMSFFNADASICDTNGNLLFYTNGLTIGNRNYDTLLNALNFNPGSATDYYEPDGLGICQPVLIIPVPGNQQRYYLFHESGEFFTAYSTLELQPFHLSYSVIDLNLDGGLGGIIDSLKNKYAIEDTLLNGGLTAVKHGNGRDWWIIVHQFYTNKFYKFLLTPEGLLGPYAQVIGSNLLFDVVVQATFSPDGSKYCISNHFGWFDYYDFDRCTGEFSNPQSIYLPDSLGIFGCSFSSNNRFLYASSLYNLYQYDTWSTNFAASVIHIAEWDSFVNPVYHIPVLFFMHQLAPDGKIYVSPWNGVEYLNVINEPDSLGLLCAFTPHSYSLTDHGYTFNIPSFPNYDLSVLEGSPCDTIVNIPTLTSELKKPSFRITPNPVSYWLNIIYQSPDDALLELFDINGHRVAAMSLYHYFKNRLINVSALPAGVYLATVTENGKRVWSEKVVVER